MRRAMPGSTVIGSSPAAPSIRPMSLRAIVSSNVALKSPRAILSPRSLTKLPGWNFENTCSASAGAIPRPRAMANTSVRPATMTNSIELPKIL